MTVPIKKLIVYRSNDISSQLFRSTIASSISFLMDFLTLICLVEIFNVHYLTAGVIGFITGTTILYFISIIWVFYNRKVKNKFFEYLIFMLLGFIGGTLNTVFLWVLTEKTGMFYMLSRITSATLIFFFNFSARKLILFTKK